MARSNKNTLKDPDRGRQQRRRAPRQPGAEGSEHIATPTEAEIAAKRRRGKTGRHVDEDTPAA
ncbi:MAG TPA: hypothetical protein VFK09_11560 [Gemmatimonadales bacterium]|jgi:hypothetical protein|nr:hypothetical protein [Gemmatimonadales bacterium]